MDLDCPPSVLAGPPVYHTGNTAWRHTWGTLARLYCLGCAFDCYPLGLPMRFCLFVLLVFSIFACKMCLEVRILSAFCLVLDLSIHRYCPSILGLQITILWTQTSCQPTGTVGLEIRRTGQTQAEPGRTMCKWGRWPIMTSATPPPYLLYAQPSSLKTMTQAPLPPRHQLCVLRSKSLVLSNFQSTSQGVDQ